MSRKGPFRIGAVALLFLLGFISSQSASAVDGGCRECAPPPTRTIVYRDPCTPAPVRTIVYRDPCAATPTREIAYRDPCTPAPARAIVYRDSCANFRAVEPEPVYTRTLLARSEVKVRTEHLREAKVTGRDACGRKIVIGTVLKPVSIWRRFINPGQCYDEVDTSSGAEVGDIPPSTGTSSSTPPPFDASAGPGPNSGSSSVTVNPDGSFTIPPATKAINVDYEVRLTKIEHTLDKVLEKLDNLPPAPKLPPKEVPSTK